MNNINILLFLSCLIFYKYSEIKNEYIKNGVLILSFYFLYNILVKKEGMRNIRDTDYASPNFIWNSDSTNGPVEGDCIVTGLEQPYYISNTAGDVESNRNQIKTFIDDNNLELPDDSNCKNTRNGSSDFYLTDKENCGFECVDKSKVIARPGDSANEMKAGNRPVITCEKDEISNRGQIKFDNEVICSPKPDGTAGTSNINSLCMAVPGNNFVYDDRDPKNDASWNECMDHSDSELTNADIKQCCKPGDGKKASYVNPTLIETWSSWRTWSNITWGLCVLGFIILVVLFGIKSDAPAGQNAAAYGNASKWAFGPLRFKPHWMIDHAVRDDKQTKWRMFGLVIAFIILVPSLHGIYYSELTNSNEYKNPTIYGFDTPANKRKVTDEITYWALMLWFIGKDISSDTSFNLIQKPPGVGRGLAIPS